jgi:hypothetical protein
MRWANYYSTGCGSRFRPNNHPEKPSFIPPGRAQNLEKMRKIAAGMGSEHRPSGQLQRSLLAYTAGVLRRRGLLLLRSLPPMVFVMQTSAPLRVW